MQPKQQPVELRDALDIIPFHNPASRSRTLRSQFTSRLSPSLAKALPGLLADCPDPDSALLLFDRLLSEGSSEILRVIESHPFLAHYAIAVFGNSRYIGETLVRNSDLLQTFLREKKLDQSFSHDEFSEALARFRSRSFERDVSLLIEPIQTPRICSHHASRRAADFAPRRNHRRNFRSQRCPDPGRVARSRECHGTPLRITTAP